MNFYLHTNSLYLLSHNLLTTSLYMAWMAVTSQSSNFHNNHLISEWGTLSKAFSRSVNATYCGLFLVKYFCSCCTMKRASQVLLFSSRSNCISSRITFFRINWSLTLSMTFWSVPVIWYLWYLVTVDYAYISR